MRYNKISYYSAETYLNLTNDLGIVYSKDIKILERFKIIDVVKTFYGLDVLEKSFMFSLKTKKGPLESVSVCLVVISSQNTPLSLLCVVLKATKTDLKVVFVKYTFCQIATKS